MFSTGIILWNRDNVINYQNSNKTTQRAIARAMLGVNLRNKITNEEMRTGNKVEDVMERIARTSGVGGGCT